MEARLAQVKALLADGEKFTFDNFSIHGPGHDRQFGGHDSPEWLTWTTRVSRAVENIARAGSAPAQLCREARGIETRNERNGQFERQKSLLMKALNETLAILEGDPHEESLEQGAVPKSPAHSNRIFIVHGHDHQLKSDLEVFLKDHGLEPVVLHRQPDEGKTIIEKFEKHADVGFAFVLLTPDEIAYTVDQKDLPDANRKTEFRARSNVIYEFGFFTGRLGRNKVCCLLKGPVSRPSDIDGLLYKDASNGLDSVAYSIIKELKVAGYTLKI